MSRTRRSWAGAFVQAGPSAPPPVGPAAYRNPLCSAGALVVAHDLARGVLRRVTTWEWLTGITDDHHAKLPHDPV